MRPRAFRNAGGTRRKAIGAVIVGGVLVTAGVTGLQFASASAIPKGADTVAVNGKQFDVSKCKKVNLDGDTVLCDGKKLQPQQNKAAEQAALAAAKQLDAACDKFAAEDQLLNDAAQNPAADKRAAEGRKSAADKAFEARARNPKAAANADKRAADKKARDAQKAGKDAAKRNNANERIANVAAAAVGSAEQALQQACLALADAKAVADDANKAAAAEREDQKANGKDAQRNKANGKDADKANDKDVDGE